MYFDILILTVLVHRGWHSQRPQRGWMDCPTYELSCINWVELLPALFAHRWPGVGHMLGCVCTAANLRWRMLLAVQAFDPFGQRIPMLGCMTARQWASVLAGGFQAFPGWHVVKGGLPLLFLSFSFSKRSGVESLSFMWSLPLVLQGRLTRVVEDWGAKELFGFLSFVMLGPKVASYHLKPTLSACSLRALCEQVHAFGFSWKLAA